MSRGAGTAAILLCFLLAPAWARAAEDLDFDPAELERKTLAWGGYAELKWEHSDLNQDGAFTLLNLHRDPRSTLDRFGSAMQLNGSLRRETVSYHWVAQAAASQDELGWYDQADIYEGYASLKPFRNTTVDVGKKVFRWGKGYAWNPVGFIDRAKDPNNPEEAMEGYMGLGFEHIQSHEGPLQTTALTAVALPVWRGVNEDFGARDNVNPAAKLYLLYEDTDIDLLWYGGNSRSSRYGIDFAKNLAANFEIHGELAYVPRQQYKVLTETGHFAVREGNDTSYLFGIRYLTENDLTAIVEFYHNDDGYTERETAGFFHLADDGYEQFLATGNNTLLRQAAMASESGYGKAQSGRNYLYARLTQKDPFDILYVAPGITAIVNVDDRSFSVSPEVVYTGFTNWEMRVRFSWLNGSESSEYGEKQNSNKLELRVRYFF